MQIGHCSIIDAATAGYDQISPHLAWLLSWAVRDTGVADGVNLIVCNPDIPPNDWGVYSPTTRSIGLNLWRHFDNVRKAIQEEANEQFSIRALLLRDLMDTIMASDVLLTHDAKCKRWIKKARQSAAKSAGGGEKRAQSG